MEPYYEEVERIIGVSGDAKANPFETRRAPYPLAPLLSHPAAALVERGAAKLGLHAFPTPRTILSADYSGRSACRYCGFCAGYGCEMGAKSSSPVSLLAWPRPAPVRKAPPPTSEATWSCKPAPRAWAPIRRGPSSVRPASSTK